LRGANRRGVAAGAGAGAVASGARGKGLGLALTKEILEANGGKISLSSEAGFGSEVTILLPTHKR
jgi:signal transduction histidine kinase